MSPRLLVVPLLGAFLLTASPSAHASDAAGLRAQVDRALVGSTARVVGVAIDVDGLGQVERRSSTTSLPPASTEKVYTADTALRLLGPTYRQRTQLRSVGTRAGALLRGDLYLVASGDPYLTSAQLDALARSFAATGIRTISGHLVVDDSRYDRARRGVGWKHEWVPEESGPLSAMALDGNAWRHDSAYLADPATPVLTKLRTYLARKGVRFTTADNRRGQALSRAAVYASHVSSSLNVTIRKVLKDSDNFAAELLLKELGRVGRGSGTAASGGLVVHQVQEPRGVGVGTVADGSGLSSSDRQTPAGELSLLTAAQASSTYQDLRQALPIGCRDGTLEHRFCGTVASGRVFAKTGTLDSARALSGWTATRDGHVVRFSFLLSGFTSGSSASKAIDRAVVVLAGATVS